MQIAPSCQKVPRPGTMSREISSQVIFFKSQKSPEKSGLFAYLAEREGFEPSIRLLTLYSLSRGAPSAARASLRGFFPHHCGAGKDTDRRGRGKSFIEESGLAGFFRHAA